TPSTTAKRVTLAPIPSASDRTTKATKDRACRSDRTAVRRSSRSSPIRRGASSNRARNGRAGSPRERAVPGTDVPAADAGSGFRRVVLAGAGLQARVLRPVTAGLVEEPADLLLLRRSQRATRPRAGGRAGLSLEDAKLARLGIPFPGQDQVKVSAVPLEERRQ